MKTLTCRPSILALVFVTAAFASAQVPAQAQRDWSHAERDYARPRDLVALQDDLNQLETSLGAIPPRHPRAQEFRSRAAAIRVDAADLADRIGRDRREGRFDQRYEEERYGADHRFVPTSLSEIDALRSRVSSLRDEVEFAESRPVSNRDFVILAGTDIEVMLDAGLSSRWSNPGDRVEASTTTAVRRNGRTLIPAGAVVFGTVREVRSRRRGQQDGWVKLDFDALIPDSGPRLDLRSHVVAISETQSGSHAARNGALGALFGGVLGGIVEGRNGALIGAAVGAGGGLLATKGHEVDLPEGTHIVVRLDRAVTLPRRDVLVSRRN